MFLRPFYATVVGAALSLGVGGAADAAIIQADIRAELGFFSFGSPRVFETTDAAVGSGIELDLSHEIANPSGFRGGVLVDIDPIATTVTVTGTDPFFDFPETGIDSADFEYVNVFITDIVFDGLDEISSLVAISDDLLNDVYGDGFTFESQFTANSISLRWFNSASEIYVEDGGAAVLSYATAQQQPDPVPAPPALSLFVVGLVGLGLLRHR